MKMLYIYCEGYSEEAFIDQVLSPYLLGFGIYPIPIICATKRTDTKKYKGGVRYYKKIKRELGSLCREHRNEIVTTMFDYYGMPSDTPCIDNMQENLYDRVRSIEKAIADDIGASNLIFNLVVHEFEGLLFTDTSAFKSIADDGIVLQLQAIREGFVSPEHINNSAYTAPSKRIEALIPKYSKVLNATKLSENIGVDAMLRECGHFRDWIKTAISRVNNNAST